MIVIYAGFLRQVALYFVFFPHFFWSFAERGNLYLMEVSV